jgi:hypothetical protein
MSRKTQSQQEEFDRWKAKLRSRDLRVRLDALIKLTDARDGEVEDGDVQFRQDV